MNDGSRRLLPPLANLQSLIVAAEHDSFSRAAERLDLTQGGVSRQIAHLEDWLQLRLFERIGRTVRLTTEGREYVEAVKPAVEQIRRATGRAIERRPELELAIATLPSFGMRWLAPRLPLLSSEIGSLIVSFSARSVPFDFGEESFDAAIHFGFADWHGVEHDLLFSEEMVAVASPSLIERYDIRSPSDVARLPLLSLGSRREAWASWFKAADIDRPPPEPAATFEQFLMLAQAAAAGAGAALLPTFLIEVEQRSGALATLFKDLSLSTGAYFLVYPGDHLKKAAFRQFRDWILREAGTSASSRTEPYPQ